MDAWKIIEGQSQKQGLGMRAAALCHPAIEPPMVRWRQCWKSSIGHMLWFKYFTIENYRTNFMILFDSGSFAVHQMPLFSHQDHGRASVSEDGTLVISSPHVDDSGVYVCNAVSSTGTAYAKVTLHVTGMWASRDLFVPITLHYGTKQWEL